MLGARIRDLIPDLLPSLFAFAVATISILTPDAHAACGWNSDMSYYSCDSLGIRNTVGRSAPQLADLVQLNAASLPTLPTPIGVEGSYSSRVPNGASRNYNASLIKGFDFLGFGLNTSNAGTFVTPSLQERFATTSHSYIYDAYARSAETGSQGYRFGTALNIPNGPLEKFFRANVGLSFGQANGAASHSNGYGLVIDARWLNFGYNVDKQNLGIPDPDGSGQVYRVLPEIIVRTLSAGLQWGPLYFGYSRMSVNIGIQPPVQIASLRWADDRWALLAAAKFDQDATGRATRQENVSLTRHFGKRLAVGYIYGLYPRAHAANVQLYF